MDANSIAAPSTMPQDGHAKSTAHAQLRGRKLLLARVVYVVLAALLLGLLIAGLPTRLVELSSGTTGIGFSYNRRGEPVLSPIAGMPAAVAGIQQGDVLLAVNGVPVVPWTWRTDINGRLAGPVDSETTFTVRSAGGSISTYTIVRGKRALQQAGIPPALYSPYLVGLDILFVLGFCIPAFVIAWRRSDDWLALLASAALILVAVSNTGEYSALVTAQPQWRSVLNVANFLYTPVLVLLLCVFPTGKFVPRRSRWLFAAAIIWGLLLQLPQPANPWAWPFSSGQVIDVAIYGLGLFAQIYRYRHVSNHQEKQQTKWVVFGMAIALVAEYAYWLPLFLVPALQEPTVAAYRYQLLGQTISYMGLLLIPLTVSISILRYHLYDIDIVINRTLVYVPLTAILAGLMAALVTGSQKAMVAMTGSTSDIATIVSTIVVVAAFTPIRERLQAFVDKRFKEVRDPNRQMRQFVKRIEGRVFPVDAHDVTRQLLEEAVAAFDAKSGAVALIGSAGDDGSDLVHMTREWDGQATLSVVLASADAGKPLGTIHLGERRHGLAYNHRDHEVLAHAAQAVALAIEQDSLPPGEQAQPARA